MRMLNWVDEDEEVDFLVEEGPIPGGSATGNKSHTDVPVPSGSANTNHTGPKRGREDGVDSTCLI